MIPFVAFKAKRAKLTSTLFPQVTRILRKKKRNLDNICLKDVYVLDALHPDFYDTDHRVRLDLECRIDDFRGVVYTRY